MLKYRCIFKRLSITLECFAWQRAVLMLAQFAMSEGTSTAFSALQLLFDGLLMIFKDDRNGWFWLVDLSRLKKHIVHCMFRLWWEDWKTIRSECYLGWFWLIDLSRLKKHIVHCMFRLWWEDWKTVCPECYLSDLPHYRYYVLYCLMCQTINP